MSSYQCFKRWNRFQEKIGLPRRWNVWWKFMYLFLFVLSEYTSFFFQSRILEIFGFILKKVQQYFWYYFPCLRDYKIKWRKFWNLTSTFQICNFTKNCNFKKLCINEPNLQATLLPEFVKNWTIIHFWFLELRLGMNLKYFDMTSVWRRPSMIKKCYKIKDRG